MELYKQYLQEINSNRRVEFDDSYFICYAICDSELFIEDMYIVPTKRKTGLASRIMTNLENIAKNHGCTCITSTCKNDRVDAINYQLKNGYNIIKEDSNILYFIKRF